MSTTELAQSNLTCYHMWMTNEMQGYEVHGYQYISISWAGSSPSGKTQKYIVTNNSGGSILGQIKWHGPWHQYVFFPSDHTLYSKGCLADIIDFISSC